MNDMDETEQKPPENQGEQGNPPEEKKEEAPQQSAEEAKPEETKPQESPEPTSQEKPEAQQPHLIETKKQEKKSIRLPNKSFIIAIITIVITIAGGIILALNLGKLTKRTPKTEEEVTTPEITPKPTLPPAIPTIQKATPSSEFEELLQPQKSKEATPSKTATEQAQPTQ